MESNKPFCGPHRVLQTLNLIQSIVYFSASAVTVFLNSGWPDSGVHIVVASAVTWIYAIVYYYIQYRDYSMTVKLAIHAINVLLALWCIAASVFACARYMFAFS